MIYRLPSFCLPQANFFSSLEEGRKNNYFFLLFAYFFFPFVSLREKVPFGEGKKKRDEGKQTPLRGRKYPFGDKKRCFFILPSPLGKAKSRRTKKKKGDPHQLTKNLKQYVALPLMSIFVPSGDRTCSPSFFPLFWGGSSSIYYMNSITNKK